jgi:hypothetical protein
MAFKQEVNVPLLMTVGVVSAVLLLVIVIGTQAWYQSEEQEEVMLKNAQATARADTLGLPDPTFVELKDGQKQALATKPHWLDEKKKTAVVIPITEAMHYLENHRGRLP